MLLGPRAFGLVVIAAFVLGACNDDGRTLEPTTATVPPSEVPATQPPAEVVGLRVTSPDVLEGEPIDPAFTCDGVGTAPVLVFSGAPVAAAELAVAVVDLDAADRVHLVVAGLPATTAQLDVARLPEGALLGRSDGGVVGWEPPCPPPDDAAHRYEVRLYAMAEPVGLSSELPGAQAVEVLERASIDVARLRFTYAAGG
ncbi:MAG: YbhB/YbcL family Raf kinase inhibitor-like protein [Acidimicrobiia bacterium]